MSSQEHEPNISDVSEDSDVLEILSSMSYLDETTKSEIYHQLMGHNLNRNSSSSQNPESFPYENIHDIEELTKMLELMKSLKDKLNKKEDSGQPDKTNPKPQTANSEKAFQSSTFLMSYLKGLPSVDAEYHQRMEIQDPTPDVHELFNEFNDKYFAGALADVFVVWSEKLEPGVAGQCAYHPESSTCKIYINKQFATLLPRGEFINVLLHEMIHAFNFVMGTYANTTAHGPEFLAIAKEISRIERIKIRAYHNHRDIVNHLAK